MKIQGGREANFGHSKTQVREKAFTDLLDTQRLNHLRGRELTPTSRLAITSVSVKCQHQMPAPNVSINCQHQMSVLLCHHAGQASFT